MHHLKRWHRLFVGQLFEFDFVLLDGWMLVQNMTVSKLLIKFYALENCTSSGNWQEQEEVFEIFFKNLF